ncbi:MAG: hypothetical protein KY457_14025 [Actinobacteria bacterium]|nr:hypothetical protein [Actinomycetota bacterium]
MTGLRYLPVVAAVLLGGCAEGDIVQRQAQTGEDGFQATGRLDGSRVAISSGDPNVTLGDCDPGDGLDEDLCILGRTIDGLRVNLVIENPGAMVPGEVVPVRADTCTEDACDEVTEHAVIDLRVDGQQVRATGGTLRTRTFHDRVTADVDLRFRNGDNLVGSFDVGVAAPSNVPPPQG